MKKNWRIIIGILSIIYIIAMWVNKGMISFEFSVPMFVTNLIVSLTKIIVIGGMILLIRFIINKIKGGIK